MTSSFRVKESGVYEGEEDDLGPGTIEIDPVFVQNIGVKRRRFSEPISLSRFEQREP
jgi:hypothetical protein